MGKIEPVPEKFWHYRFFSHKQAQKLLVENITARRSIEKCCID